MENEVMVQVLTFATLIGLIVSVAVEMVKKGFEAAGKPLRAAFIPTVAFVVGLIFGAAAYPFTDMDLVLRLWAGGIAGWMASGLYEQVKKTTKF